MGRSATAAEIAAARTRDELRKIADRYGYAPGWVSRVIAARQRRKSK